SRLDEAQHEEQFQAVGLLCREVLISAAQEVYDEDEHSPADGPKPSPTDAKRMLGGIFDAEFKGNANEEARRHARAAVDLSFKTFMRDMQIPWGFHASSSITSDFESRLKSMPHKGEGIAIDKSTIISTRNRPRSTDEFD